MGEPLSALVGPPESQYWQARRDAVLGWRFTEKGDRKWWRKGVTKKGGRSYRTKTAGR